MVCYAHVLCGNYPGQINESVASKAISEASSLPVDGVTHETTDRCKKYLIAL